MKKYLALFFGVLIGILLGQSMNFAFAASIPQGGALFETSLQDRISSTDTSLTLVANSLRGGESLSGYNCLTIDEGRTDQEFVCGTVSGTSVTGLSRGISFLTGTTTIAGNQWAHRKGANVKVTDYPALIIVQRILGGTDTIANILRYTSHPTFTGTTDVVDKKYVDDAAFSGAGVIDATTAARGVSQLASGLQAASSTAQGSSGVLVIPASLATSTYNSATAALKVVVTKNSGKIDDNFISTSTLFTNLTFATTTQIGAFPAWQSANKYRFFRRPVRPRSQSHLVSLRFMSRCKARAAIVELVLVPVPVVLLRAARVVDGLQK
jgi:hypothetical protein